MSPTQCLYLITSGSDHQDTASHNWAVEFKRYLELLLTRLSGGTVKIHRVDCDELDVSSIYTPFTILLPIVTDHLLNSSTFNDEIKHFHEKAINSASNSIPWNTRVFKVFRQPKQGHYLLDYLSDSINYDFFHYESGSNDLVIYDDFDGPLSEKTFWMKLYDLANDIFQTIDRIKDVATEIAHIAGDLNQISVYLAEVGTDLVAERDSVRRELQRCGFRVLPEKNMPKDLDSIMKQVNSNLLQCNLSVHLVGSDEGIIQGSNSSIVDLQNRKATEHFGETDKIEARANMKFGRVIWISPNMNNIGVKQRLFIENLKKDSESMEDADLLESTIEELKSFLISKLEDCKLNHQRLYGRGAQTKKLIYFIRQKEDTSKCKIITKFLEKNGFDVISSDFGSDLQDSRISHSESLQRCDAALIYYGHENEGWIKSKQQDLLKARAFGREKPISPRAILIENEAQLKKSLSIDQMSIILHNQDKFSPKVMEPFLAKLKE
jgi:hypothetical protein